MWVFNWVLSSISIHILDTDISMILFYFLFLKDSYTTVYKESILYFLFWLFLTIQTEGVLCDTLVLSCRTTDPFLRLVYRLFYEHRSYIFLKILSCYSFVCWSFILPVLSTYLWIGSPVYLPFICLFFYEL